MNYEQKYKEAIERCKSWMKGEHPECFTEAQKAGEFIFPELRESEDENIRKGLIKGLSAMRDIHKHQTFSDDAINIDDAIAWLEKQGEHANFRNKIQVGDKVTRNEDGVLVNLSQLKRVAKPNDWKPSEEQMEAIKYFIDFHRPQANASIEGWNEFKHLESLYNDLKNFES